MSISFTPRFSSQYLDEPSVQKGEACRQDNPYYEGANKASPASRPMTEVESAHKILQADAQHRSLAADQVLMLEMVMPFFKTSLRQLQSGLFNWFSHQGFWGNRPGIMTTEQERMKKTEKLALIVTEVSECIEAVRKDDKENEAEELADVLVRVLDYAGGFDIPLAEAFQKKMVANYGRPFKHGKHF